MNFGPQHYVPVLKIKRGEKQALGMISPALQSQITPLLEIVELKEKTIEEHINTAFKNLAAGVWPYPRCFLDAREVAGSGPAEAENIFQRAADEGIAFTPVTGVTRIVDVAAALKHGSAGIALRLSREEFEGGGLRARIMRFVGTHSLAIEETDLIIDLGAVDNLIPDGIAAFTAAFLDEIPKPKRWRTLTVSGSAFPPSMGKGVVDRHSHSLVERAEWLAWRDGLHANGGDLDRLPTFSDCAIQHPKGVEGFNFRTMTASASVRYTCPEDWLLIKGESTKRTPAKIQFPGLATQLVNGNLKGHYFGVHHCEGCRLMKAAADGADKLGSPEVWRRLGTVHHITTVMEQVAAMPSP